DNSRIFYGRVDSTPRGVFSISPLGGTEHLVLENAKSAEPVADGSLVVVRINDQRREQFYRFWPDTGRLQAYPASPIVGDFSRLRVITGTMEGLFVGRATDPSRPERDPPSHNHDRRQRILQRLCGNRMRAVWRGGAAARWTGRRADAQRWSQSSCRDKR